MKHLVKNMFAYTAIILAACGSMALSGLFFLCANVSAEEAAALISPDYSERYAYRELNDEEKDCYLQLCEGIAARKSSFKIHTSDSELVKPALTAILRDCPEFFWIDGTASMTGFKYLGSWDIELGFNIPEEEIEPVENAIRAEVSAFLDTIPAEASEYRRARMAYDNIITATDYDLESPQNQNIQSVFLHGRSVCAGYARAYQYLCYVMGVPCTYVEGNIEEDGRTEGHAWNLVWLDGNPVYVDPSWGDPTYGEDSTDAKRLSIIYDYFGLTGEEMLRSHHYPDEGYTLPECTCTEYDYYRLNDMYYEYADADEIASAIWNAVDAAESSVFFKFASSDAYCEAYALLFPDSEERESLIAEPMRRRMEWDEVDSIRYFYSCSEELRIIKVYW